MVSPSPSHLSITSTTVDEGRFLPGTLIAGRYRITTLLGRGGMGEVYRATDLTLAQSVALKFLPESAAGNLRLLERFHNEVRVARQVSHPNVCRVYDIGEADGLPFISMEYVDGEDLATLMARIGRLPSDKAMEIARKLCAGVAAAHDRGILHRDLKPQNLMLNRRGEVVIMDFGLAAVAEELRGAEARNGTPAYMAPEQLRGENVTQRSDIYAIGLIIYELFAGKRAWEADTVPDLIARMETSRPPTLTSLAPDADPAVEKVIGRCLQADPWQRPTNALAVAAALPGGDPLAAALAAGETPSPELVAASGKRQGIALGYAGAMLALVVLGLLAFPLVRQQVFLMGLTPLELPPAALALKAQEIAASLGHPERPRDWRGWLYVNSQLSEYMVKKRGDKSYGELYAAEDPFRYMYVQSRDYLRSDPDGTINHDRPALTEPGMMRVLLDSRGRLRGMDAVPPRWTKPGAEAPLAPNAEAAFRAAGLDIEKFEKTAPSRAPQVGSDLRQAWTGKHPELPDTPITIELASFGGRVTSFHLIWPYTSRDAGGFRESPRTLAQRALSWFSLVLMVVAGFLAVFFAWRNLRAGRGDHRGAVRVGLAFLVLSLGKWTFHQHWMPHEAMLGYVLLEVATALGASVLLALLYLALEPAVRARWPHTLITWNRLLGGEWKDPRVGSHILTGAVAGVVILYLFSWRAAMALDSGLPPFAQDLQVVNGPGHLFGTLLGVLASAILVGSVVFFVLCGFRALVRLDWVAAICAAVLLTAQEGSIRESTNLWLDLGLYILVFAALSFVLLRLGLLAATVTVCFINVPSRLPVPHDPGAWYTGYMVTLLAVLIGISVFAFVRSQSEPKATLPERF